MSTPIQPVPDVVLASEFPSLADRPAGTYNAKAKAWADSENAMAQRTREIALTAHNNAIAAEEQAQAAALATGGAEDAKEAAEAARDKAQEWAEGVEPEPGSRSAKTWAMESQDYRDSAWAAAAAAGVSAGLPTPLEPGKVLGVTYDGIVAWLDAMQKASVEQAIEGEDDEVVMTPFTTREAVRHFAFETGDIRISRQSLQAPDWLPVTSSRYLVRDYPELSEFYARIDGLGTQNIVPSTGLTNGFHVSGVSENGDWLVVADGSDSTVAGYFLAVYERQSDGTFSQVATVSSDLPIVISTRVSGLAITNGGTYIAVSTVENSAALSNLFVLKRTGSSITLIQDLIPVSANTMRTQAVKFFGNDGYLVARGSASVEQVWSRSGDTFTQIHSATGLTNVFGRTMPLAVTANGSGNIILSAAGATIRVLSQSGDVVTHLPGSDITTAAVIESLEFSPDGSLLVVAHQVAPWLSLFSRSGTTFTALPAVTDNEQRITQFIKFGGNGNVLITYSTTSGGLQIFDVNGLGVERRTDFAVSGVNPNGSFTFRNLALSLESVREPGGDYSILSLAATAPLSQRIYNLLEIDRVFDIQSANAQAGGTLYVKT